MQWYLKVLTNYFGFSGRARRAEYWWFVLINLIIELVLYFVGVLVSREAAGVLLVLYGIAILIPGLAVSIRRLHDAGFSGWWLLLGFVPLGAIVLLIFYCLDSQPGANRFGANPKEEAVLIPA